jgi:predicted nucleotidyltransferase component of viral defense system
MKITEDDFAQLVNKAMQDNSVSHMRPVIEKELLHYDILFCLEEKGLLDNLVFQGGTSLRLCRGGSRFSEDLDFAGGKDFSSAMLSDIKSCLQDYIGKRYGLKVAVKEPAALKEDAEYAELNIDKWQISVITTPDRKDVPRQRIKIEIANVPAYTKEALPLKVNYDFLPDGYEDTLIFTETLDEVMADKLVSLPATQRYVRHRDIWDLSWLKQQGAVMQPELVRQKIADYRLTDFPDKLDLMIHKLPAIINGADFKNEMKRFLPTDVYDRTLGKEKFEGFLINTITGLFTELKQKLYGQQVEPEFKM